MINISIDPPDLKVINNAAIAQEENLAINEIESVYELISEGIFNYKLPESEDNDMDTKASSIDLYCFNNITVILNKHGLRVVHTGYNPNNFSHQFSGPGSPPPKDI